MTARLNKCIWTIFAALFCRAGLCAGDSPQPPRGLRVEQQDAQAFRIRWINPGNDLGVNLFASYDVEPLDFHQDNVEPLKQTFVIWDAPRKGSRKFVFYLTSVDKNGRQSAPSTYVRAEIKSQGAISEPTLPVKLK